jgi:hypothetical protein
VIAIPGFDASGDAIPFEDILVGIADDTGFERDHRIRNLEGRGRQLRLARAVLVAGNDQIIVDLVADESADRSRVGEMFGQILADLAALVHDMGKGPRRHQARACESTEHMATIDHHDNVRC